MRHKPRTARERRPGLFLFSNILETTDSSPGRLPPMETVEMASVDLSLSGLASGFDWKSVVEQLTQLERTPQTRLRAEQDATNLRASAYKSIQTQVSNLRARSEALKSTDLFNARAANTSDSAVATATAGPGAAVGSYVLNVTKLSKAAAQQGSVNVGSALSAGDDVSGLVLKDAGFSTAVSAGNITVNGRSVAIAETDTLQDVFDKISTATFGEVTGSYSSDNDQITLNSTGPLILGSGTDTSNFLQVAKLYNTVSGNGPVTSATKLGSVRQNTALDSANFATPLTGGSAGKFKVNGVEISFDTAADKVSDVLKRINDSGAGVMAGYDVVNDRFILTNKKGGDVGMALEDVSGNFLAATGLASGTLARGQDMAYTINDGPSLTARGNTITEESSGIPGLTVNVVKAGTATIGVSSDSARIKSAINDFIAEYNSTQTLIDSRTASTIDSSGKVSSSVLAGDSDAGDIAGRLRRLSYGDVEGLSGTLNRLEKLGITTNGQDNKISLSDPGKLDAALATNLSDVRDFFTNSTTGLATKLVKYMDTMVGDDGVLIQKQKLFTDQSTSVDKQVADQERMVQVRRQQLIDGFVAMETAQSKSNAQLSYLQKNFK